MARKIGNKCKFSRRVQSDIGLKSRGRDIATKCKLKTLPGQHGPNKKGRPSEYGVMLSAKQMLRHMYGVLEKQFRKYYAEASRKKGITGELLLELLESRLDNVVYRMGFGCTRAEARQLVRHKSIVVKPQGNEEKAHVVNIPSFNISPGDIVEVREKSRGQVRIQDSLRVAESLGFPEWVSVASDKMAGTFKRVPARDELPAEINEQLVVELYSK